MPLIDLTNDEVYQMVKLYDHLRDIDMIDDLPVAVEIAFDKIQAKEVDKEAEQVEQCIIDTNGDYAECVDRMVATMKSPVELENVTDAWYDKEGNLIP
tara:strand:+ start:440 stop:733 length:294 start_codon:yes stop_codon:yes gene_type:complete